MQIDPTITFGNILSMVIMLAAVFAAAWRIIIQLKKIQWKMRMIWRWYSKEHGIPVEDDDDEN